jgi:hypothetical protein
VTSSYENTITLSIFLLGILTVFLSIVVAVRFNHYRRAVRGHHAGRLSGAISWQLIGEAVIGLGTLIFSAAAHYKVLPSWPIEVQSFLRFIMFLATSVTTWHLYKTLLRIGNP